MSSSEDFITIPGRTTIRVDVGDGVVIIRNCNPGKMYINVEYEKKKLARVE